MIKIYSTLIVGLGLGLLILFIGAAAFNTAWPEITLPIWLQLAISFVWGSTGAFIAIRIMTGELE